MQCVLCKKNTYVIHITKEHQHICSNCYDKRNRPMEHLAQEFYNKRIIVDGHFKLNSGLHTDKYIYKDKIYCDPELFKKCIDGLIKLITDSDIEIDCVASPSAGGVVLGAPVAIELNKPLIYGEKNEDGTFRLRKCFRDFVYDKKIILIDDIYSSGKTISNMHKVIKGNEGVLTGIFCIWNRAMQKTLDRAFSIDIRALVQNYIDVQEPKYCYQCTNNIPITNLK